MKNQTIGILLVLFLIPEIAQAHIPISQNGGIHIPISKIQQAKSLGDLYGNYCQIMRCPTATHWELDRRLNRTQAFLGTGKTLVLNQKRAETANYLQADFDQQTEILETSISLKGQPGTTKTSKGSPMNSTQTALLGSLKPGDVIEVRVKFGFKDSRDAGAHKGDFLVTVVPETEATFPGGEMGISAFVEKEIARASLQLPEDYFAHIALLINEKGMVESVHIPEGNVGKATEAHLVRIFKAMPAWKPARDKNQKPASQKMELVMGVRGC